MPTPFDTTDTVQSLNEQAADLQAYLDQLKGKAMPTSPPPRPAPPPEPTLRDLIKQRFMENAAILNKSRQAPIPDKSAPTVQNAQTAPNQPGSFNPARLVSDYLKNRPTPGAFQPSQWVKRPPAPTAPQPGTGIAPTSRGALVPQGNNLPARISNGGALDKWGPWRFGTQNTFSGTGGSGPGRWFGGMPSAGLANLIAPAAGIASQRDIYPSIEALAASRKGQINAPSSVDAAASIQKDQSRMPMTPAWTGMIPSPAMAQARPAPAEWSAGTPLPRPRPQVPLPRPRPQIPIARPGVGGKGAAPVQPAQQPAFLDQLLRALLGTPRSYDQQGVNIGNR